ncbi:hypothetical protein B0H16DRAFT_1504859 [Mycena metata]|uniref:Uncharacterized protein n=1 Tax=Mycena metata TaxID=1033252 RepID=A0AAD7K7G9_9AGAR|nr:hypothetical protein B0H16DRAFT_1504859 [Mycena metata]
MWIGTVTVLLSSCLASVPPNVSAIEAAGPGIVTATSYQGLVEQAHLKSGQTVFINRGSVGVGLFGSLNPWAARSSQPPAARTKISCSV